MNILAYILVGLIWVLSFALAYNRGWSKGFDEGVDIYKSAYLQLSEDYCEFLKRLEESMNE